MGKDLRMVWLDMEMNGLDPTVHQVLEMAIIITDAQLETLAVSPVWVVRHDESIKEQMDKWNLSTHTKSGLIDRVLASTQSIKQIEDEALAFLKAWVSKEKAPLCGNSVHQDRRFLQAFMPSMEAYLHYRNIDVSTLKELAKRWSPELYKKAQGRKKSRHTALADIEESIEEMKFYREHFLNLPPQS